MPIRVLSFFTILPFFLFLPLLQGATNENEKLNIIFIYPGGEGSGTEAEPLLKLLADQIKKEGGPDVSIRYTPSLAEGVKLVGSWPANLGLISIDAYLQEKEKITMGILLAAQPVFSYSSSYVLMAGIKNPPGSNPETIYCSRPLPRAFLGILFPPTTVDPKKTTSVKNILPLAKKIAMGEEKSAVLLDPFEYANLKKLKLPWVASLKEAVKSPSLPASPLVFFNPLPGDVAQQLTRAMTNLNNTAEGREILHELRLKGFEKPRLDDYDMIYENFLKARLAPPNIPAESPN